MSNPQEQQLFSGNYAQLLTDIELAPDDVNFIPASPELKQWLQDQIEHAPKSTVGWGDRRFHSAP